MTIGDSGSHLFHQSELGDPLNLKGMLNDKDKRIAELEAVLAIAESWLERWASHVANCRGGDECTCGLTRVRFDAQEALNNNS